MTDCNLSPYPCNPVCTAPTGPTGTPFVPLSISNVTLLSEAFGNVQHITGHLHVRKTDLTSLGTAFRRLQTVGRSLQINLNPNLTSLGVAFGNLTTIGTGVQFRHNSALATVRDTAFGSLESIGTVLLFNRNGGQALTVCPQPAQRAVGRFAKV